MHEADMMHGADMMLQVRRRALEVMEAVLRGGVMPPFSAVPTLFALTTDPTRYFLESFCSMPPERMHSVFAQQTRHAHSLR